VKILRSLVAVLLAVMAFAVPASADETAQSLFNFPKWQKVDPLCVNARNAAHTISDTNGNISPSQAHRATRSFLHCGAKFDQAIQPTVDYYALLAAGSELIAASHETGASAALSRKNALTLLRAIGARPLQYFTPVMRNAPPQYGKNAVVITLNVQGPAQRFEAESPFATIANELIAGIPTH
jgi:hypothetical protein